MKIFKGNHDMTEGSIPRNLLTFAFPIMFSSLFHLIYSLADSIIVGQFIGGNALAAVSVTGNACFFPLQEESIWRWGLGAIFLEDGKRKNIFFKGEGNYEVRFYVSD